MNRLFAAIPATSFLPLTAAADDPVCGNFLATWDADGNGTVGIEEALAHRDSVYFAFDANADGFLDPEECAQFDKARDAVKAGKGRGRRVTQQAMTPSYNDIDQDGRVSRGEFLSRTFDWVAEVDVDGDGQISAADIAPQS